MATPSQVRGVSEQIDNGIEIQRRRLADAKKAFAAAVTALSNYPTQFQDYLSTVDGYAPTGASETLAQDIKSKQVTEFQELQAAAQTVKTFLEGIDEF